MREIPLTQGKVAVVDDEDFERVARLKWQACRCFQTWYAKTGSRKDRICLHRFVLQAKAGQEVDHVNGDGLDNRRQNLRFCTSAQNHANQRKSRGVSSFKGVTWDKVNRKWNAQIKTGGRRINLGRFSDEAAAARAYNVAAVRLWGDFARINEIDGGRVNDAEALRGES